MADKIVQVPGIGNVSFPDTMSDGDISTAITRQIQGQQQQQPQGTSAAAPDTTPLNQQNPVRRFAERAFGIPDRVFDHPNEYLNPFSSSYWHPSPQVQADRENMTPHIPKSDPNSTISSRLNEMMPAQQTVSDLKAGNYAGAAGDVLPDALAVAQIGVPAAGKVLQMPGMAKAVPRTGRYVGAGVGYKTGGPIGAAVGAGAGEIAGRGLLKAAPWMARSVGVGTGEPAPSPETPPTASRPTSAPAQVQEQPVAQESPQSPSTAPQSAKEWLDNLLKGGTQQPPPSQNASRGYGLTPQSTEEFIGPPGKNPGQYGLTPQSLKELQEIMAEPPSKPRPAGWASSGGAANSGGPDWQKLTEESLARQGTRASTQQQAVMPTRGATPQEQAWADAMANFATSSPSPGDMDPYYGKTRQTGMPTPHELLKPHERQLASPTFSTAPGQQPAGPHPPEIMRILNTPGDIPSPDWETLQNYFAKQKLSKMLAGATAGR